MLLSETTVSNIRYATERHDGARSRWYVRNVPRIWCIWFCWILLQRIAFTVLKSGVDCMRRSIARVSPENCCVLFDLPDA